jgi:hypothetical protein
MVPESGKDNNSITPMEQSRRVEASDANPSRGLVSSMV